jgi:hypothetical protein
LDGTNLHEPALIGSAGIVCIVAKPVQQLSADPKKQKRENELKKQHRIYFIDNYFCFIIFAKKSI